MTQTDLQNIALREAARAVLVDHFDNGSVLKISVLPTTKALGFVRWQPRSNGPTTISEMEGRITSLLGGIAARSLTGAADDSGECSSAAYAQHLAETAADAEQPNWRSSDPELANNIGKRCLDRATQLVALNAERTRKVAAVLVVKGSLSGEDLAAI